VYWQEFQVYEIKAVNCTASRSSDKSQGENMKDSLAMLLKTNGEKMSDNRSLAMLMKTMELLYVSRDVHEKRAGYATIEAKVECP